MANRIEINGFCLLAARKHLSAVSLSARQGGGGHKQTAGVAGANSFININVSSIRFVCNYISYAT